MEVLRRSSVFAAEIMDAFDRCGDAADGLMSSSVWSAQTLASAPTGWWLHSAASAAS
uniref:Bcl-2-related ovarian killer protein isoform 5 n=1 Tax=Homo sapiens TaxID=9606 RepID=A0A481T0B6_HUMAN|nr:bcl-2-related ovarian killer protein isoform 5 [Homo sapiens]QBH74601.1 bcl-2-related ovarian killer protein isoform 5 [Homo sapiens]